MLTAIGEDGKVQEKIEIGYWKNNFKNDGRDDTKEEDAIIWKSTIGAFCEKNIGLFVDDKKRKKFLEDLESHLVASEGVDWGQPCPGASGIASSAEDIAMLHQVIEILCLIGD